MIFDLFKNLPLLIFVAILCIIFVLFLWGVSLLTLAGARKQRIARARNIILSSLYCFFVFLIVFLVFLLVTSFLEKGKVFLPPQASGDFPYSPITQFPPSPQFTKIENYYFSDPSALNKYSFFKGPLIYSILCKKKENYDSSLLAKGEGYDIIYVEELEGESDLSKHEQYKCWLENCNENLNNLYLVSFLTPKEKYDKKQRQQIEIDLRSQIDPPCLPSEI